MYFWLYPLFNTFIRSFEHTSEICLLKYLFFVQVSIFGNLTSKGQVKNEMKSLWNVWRSGPLSQVRSNRCIFTAFYQKISKSFYKEVSKNKVLDYRGKGCLSNYEIHKPLLNSSVLLIFENLRLVLAINTFLL